uniref:hypothetical protein n=1 Tax=Candidatus Vondammii sp. HM_W22 TaxID=2687299 RepID=UPI002E7B191C|nr:hypothetical protein [Candidatus Vondammii sp. HM_W22]
MTFDGDRVEELGWAQANVCRDKLDITLRSRAHKARILFPALGTPALLCGQGKQLKVILAVSDAFHQEINAERQPNPAKSIGPMTLRRLHAQFRLKPWSTSDKHHPDLDRIYENWQTAQENIRLYPRGELKNSSETGLPVSDNNGKCIGILHPDIIDFYRKHGYTRLYQVNLNKLPPPRVSTTWYGTTPTTKRRTPHPLIKSHTTAIHTNPRTASRPTTSVRQKSRAASRSIAAASTPATGGGASSPNSPATGATPAAPPSARVPQRAASGWRTVTLSTSATNPSSTPATSATCTSHPARPSTQTARRNSSPAPTPPPRPHSAPSPTTAPPP